MPSSRVSVVCLVEGSPGHPSLLGFHCRPHLFHLHSHPSCKHSYSIICKISSAKHYHLQNCLAACFEACRRLGQDGFICFICISCWTGCFVARAVMLTPDCNSQDPIKPMLEQCVLGFGKSLARYTINLCEIRTWTFTNPSFRSSNNAISHF